MRFVTDAESSRLSTARSVELPLDVDELSSGATVDDESQHSFGVRGECDFDILQCVARTRQLTLPGPVVRAPQIVEDDDSLDELIIGFDIEFTEAEFFKAHHCRKTRSLGQKRGDNTATGVIETEVAGHLLGHPDLQTHVP